VEFCAYIIPFFSPKRKRFFDEVAKKYKGLLHFSCKCAIIKIIISIMTRVFLADVSSAAETRKDRHI